MPRKPGMPVILMDDLEQLAGRQPGRNILEVWRTGFRPSENFDLSMPGPPWHRTRPILGEARGPVRTARLAWGR
jgi:hypothetical protein